MAGQSNLDRTGSQRSSQTPAASSHRLPTISASQALQKLRSGGNDAVSTGLPTLDATLVGPTSSVGRTSGGILRGKLTEIYGPPGVGKTAFGLQAAASAIKSGHTVVWIDASSTLSYPRLLAVLSKSSAKTATPERNFSHFIIPTLPHLLALFSHPVPTFPPEGTSLIVIDSISTLFDNAYHKNPNISSGTPTQKATNTARWAAGRKFAVLGDLASKLSKTAVLHNLAILVTSQTMTRVRAGQGALLLPALSSSEWTSSIATQLVLFRDWPPQQDPQQQQQQDEDQEARWDQLRYAGVIKVNGTLAADEGRFVTVVPFAIGGGGLQELALPRREKLAVPITNSPAKGTKRPFVEIADSEDEEDALLTEGEEEAFACVEADELAAEGLVVDDRGLGTGDAGEEVD